MGPTHQTRMLNLGIAGFDFERSDAMPISRTIILGGFIAFAFLSINMQNDRFCCIFSLF